LNLALNGQTLDLLGVRRLIDGYKDEVLPALGSLFQRVQASEPPAYAWSKTTRFDKGCKSRKGNGLSPLTAE
jgi:hypothetical protein